MFYEINYVYISFSFQAKKQNAKQTVKRDNRKVEDEIKTESTISFTMKIIFKQKACETFPNLMNAA